MDFVNAVMLYCDMGDTNTKDKDLVLEILKKLQTGMSELRNAVADVRQDTRTIKDEIVSLRTIMGEFIKTDARREGDHLLLSARVDRLERRLDLQDNPPS
jgi:hypothetical protein